MASGRGTGISLKVCPKAKKGSRVYFEGQGDLGSRLITPIAPVVTLLIPITNLLTKSP